MSAGKKAKTTGNKGKSSKKKEELTEGEKLDLEIQKDGKRRQKEQEDRARRIKNEVKRLNGAIKEVDSAKKKTARGLVDEAAFMKVTLEDLKEIVNLSGVVDEMPQGEYSILREHPALKSYNTMVQRYTNVLSKLNELHPKMDIKAEDDGFFEFVNSK